MTDFEYEDERLLSVTERQAHECRSRRVEPMWKLDVGAGSLELADAPTGSDGSGRPWALLLDGGDLGDVHRILDLARTPLVRLTDTVPTQECCPRRLLVASGNKALQMERHPVDPDDDVVTIAILNRPSRTLARRVRSLGFTYVVERPVHPDALRQLLISSLYREGERRAEKRFPVGCDVRLRAGWRRRDAVLAELSRWGCSLEVEEAPVLGARLKLCLPTELTGSEPLVLPADVVRSERRHGAEEAANVSLLFESDPKVRARLGPILSRLRVGPPTRKQEAA